MIPTSQKCQRSFTYCVNSFSRINYQTSKIIVSLESLTVYFSLHQSQIKASKIATWEEHALIGEGHKFWGWGTRKDSLNLLINW